MRRRVVATVWPAWMERYDPAEWPDGPQSWYDACEEWSAAHPDVDPPSPETWPDVPWDPELI